MPRAAVVLVFALVAIAIVGPLVAKDPEATDIDRGPADNGAPLPPSGNALPRADPLGRAVGARDRRDAVAHRHAPLAAERRRARRRARRARVRAKSDERGGAVVHRARPDRLVGTDAVRWPAVLPDGAVADRRAWRRDRDRGA